MISSPEQLIPRTRKLAALDGLRGTAVLVVMLSHLQRFLPATPLMEPAKVLLSYGWIGVDLFFVLSGFLITGILVQSKAATNYFQSFYVRRFLRIFPIYYLTLAIIFGVAIVVPGIPNVPAPNERWLYFTYVLNWIPVWSHTWPPNVLGHFWSLAVEEQFYLVWPICVLVLSRRGLLTAGIVLSVSALAVRCVWVTHSAYDPNEAVIMSTVTRMDSLLLGAIVALSARSIMNALRPHGVSLISVASLGAFVIGCAVVWRNPFPFITTVGYTLLAVGFAALVLVAALTDGEMTFFQRVFRNTILSRVGKYSYGMYVYHVPLLGLAELLVFRHFTETQRSNPLFCVPYVVFLVILTFAVAAASFEFFERPILQLKRRAEPVFALRDQAGTTKTSTTQSLHPVSAGD